MRSAASAQFCWPVLKPEVAWLPAKELNKNYGSQSGYKINKALTCKNDTCLIPLAILFTIFWGLSWCSPAWLPMPEATKKQNMYYLNYIKAKYKYWSKAGANYSWWDSSLTSPNAPDYTTPNNLLAKLDQNNYSNESTNHLECISRRLALVMWVASVGAFFQSNP